MKAASSLLAAALVLAVAGCTNDDADTGRQDTTMDTPAGDAARSLETAPDAMGMAPDPAATGAAMPAAEGDRKALMAVAEVDRHEIAAAELALAKDVEGDVQDYAQTLLDDHTRNLEATQRLMDGTGSAGGGAAGTGAAAPADAELAAMMEKHNAEHERLSDMEGEEFANAWIDAMVKGHEEALAKLDDELIPGAGDAEVRSQLQDTRTAIAGHLETARSLQSAER